MEVTVFFYIKGVKIYLSKAKDSEIRPYLCVKVTFQEFLPLIT